VLANDGLSLATPIGRGGGRSKNKQRSAGLVGVVQRRRDLSGRVGAGKKIISATGFKAEEEAKDTDAGSATATLYELPHLYDKVFGFRDYDDEVDFIAHVYSEQNASAALKSVLDLGCGTGRHCMALAAKGYSVTGVDSSKPMLEYAGRLCSSNGVSGIEFVEQDMTSFVLGSRNFQVATILLGTLSHLHSNADVIRCFKRVGEHLTEGGILLLELAHPSQLFSLPMELGTEAWDVRMADEEKEDIVVQYGLEEDIFDPVNQLLTRTVTLSHPEKKKGGKKGGKEKKNGGGPSLSPVPELPLKEVVVQRFFTCQEIRLLAEFSGFRVVKMYGDMEKNCIIGTDEDEEFRMVVVLKKTTQ
jgi:ubiquinone/menaquinone biosynthesis C-methylase UbiE